LGPLKKDIAEMERMLKMMIKSLENKPLDLFSDEIDLFELLRFLQ